jgi:L-threonylcarbamoyladenylate synthase
MPAAVMFFQLDTALAAVPELGPRTAAALEEILPGPVTLLLPNPAGRFPLACGPDAGTLGLRVPSLPPAVQALETVRVPILQTSANLSGAPEARTLAEVPEALHAAVDVVLDGGELPGLASTVVDLRAYEDEGSWTIVRPGALPPDRVAEALG